MIEKELKEIIVHKKSTQIADYECFSFLLAEREGFEPPDL
jgi:hypothetical protein